MQKMNSLRSHQFLLQDISLLINKLLKMIYNLLANLGVLLTSKRWTGDLAVSELLLERWHFD